MNGKASHAWVLSRKANEEDVRHCGEVRVFCTRKGIAWTDMLVGILIHVNHDGRVDSETPVELFNDDVIAHICENDIMMLFLVNGIDD